MNNIYGVLILIYPIKEKNQWIRLRGYSVIDHFWKQFPVDWSRCATGFRAHALFERCVMSTLTVKKLHLTCHRMRCHVLHLMVERVSSKDGWICTHWRSDVCFPFSIFRRWKCSTIPSVVDIFISVPDLLIMFCGPDICYRSFALFQFCHSMKIN